MTPIITSKQINLLNRIEEVIVEIVENDEKLIFSEYIQKRIGKDYTYLSNLFSRIKGVSIQRYIQILRMNKVKKFLSEDEYSLSQISYKMNYSSVAHLSNQFKRMTGQTPSEYKKSLKYEVEIYNTNESNQIKNTSQTVQQYFERYNIFSKEEIQELKQDAIGQEITHIFAEESKEKGCRIVISLNNNKRIVISATQGDLGAYLQCFTLNKLVSEPKEFQLENAN